MFLLFTCIKGKVINLFKLSGLNGQFFGFFQNINILRKTFAENIVSITWAYFSNLVTSIFAKIGVCQKYSKVWIKSMKSFFMKNYHFWTFWPVKWRHTSNFTHENFYQIPWQVFELSLFLFEKVKFYFVMEM